MLVRCRSAAAGASPLGSRRTVPHQGAVPSDVRLVLAAAPDLDAPGDVLGAEWRALEARSEGSFFRSWTWVGCLAAARFADPVLLRAERGGATVGLALCNRRHGALWLGESGDPAWDAVYVEHNGPLLARGAEGLLPACIGTLLGAGWRGRRLRLSGVDAAHLAAARSVGAVRLRRRDPAPWLDFSALGQGDGALLAGLSANARYQLRRSDRAYAAAGPIRVERAATPAEAAAFLDALAALHQATWTARNQPGAFANPLFFRFHRALVARALPRGEVDLLRIAAGGTTIGYLYNFRHQGRVLAYQSGFDYAAAGPHQKPGLTCHHAAIRFSRAQGARAYDFLAGGDRYKTSFANATAELVWLDAAPRTSLRGLAYRLEGLIRVSPTSPAPGGR
jgi:CelD/BcsL family acetyltransferase involved in cellulose biosynthesis